MWRAVTSNTTTTTVAMFMMVARKPQSPWQLLSTADEVFCFYAFTPIPVTLREFYIFNDKNDKKKKKKKKSKRKKERKKKQPQNIRT